MSTRIKNELQRYDSPNEHGATGSMLRRTISGAQGLVNISTFVRVVGKMPSDCLEADLPTNLMDALNATDSTVNWRDFYEANQ